MRIFGGSMSGASSRKSPTTTAAPHIHASVLSLPLLLDEADGGKAGTCYCLVVAEAEPRAFHSYIVENVREDLLYRQYGTVGKQLYFG